MSLRDEPLVSVVTPVYNGEDYLVECIESILSQTYRNLEYIIVNNASTDRTLDIALEYAKRDSRVRIHTNKELVNVMENHNIGLSLISPQARYCKVVCADDFIFPECLLKMVELAEANPAVGMVGSYSLAGKKVMYTGLEYEKNVVGGRDLCRATLLGGPYIFGCPTSLLYRADFTRRSPRFFPNSSPHCDTTACYQVLEDSDYGFVHQVLSYTRIHSASQTSQSLHYGMIKIAVLSDLCQYGPKFLNPQEMKKRLSVMLDDYYRTIAHLFPEQRRNKEFWERQERELRDLGLTFSRLRLWKTILSKSARWVYRPHAAITRLFGGTKNRDLVAASYYESDAEI